MEAIAVIFIGGFILAGLIVTFIGHQKFRPDNDHIESHDNWNDNDTIRPNQ